MDQSHCGTDVADTLGKESTYGGGSEPDPEFDSFESDFFDFRNFEKKAIVDLG